MSEPCNHESAGEVKGIKPAVYGEFKLVWSESLHLCRLCKCLYVATVPEGTDNQIMLDLKSVE